MQPITWLTARFDEWQKAEFGLFSFSTVYEFERNVGELKARTQMDIPPYAELLIQGGKEVPVAVRHPEYMLARDLECLHNLYLDTEALLNPINWLSPPDWAGGASENAQTLARTAILTCFNLLESFVSGLAKTHVIDNPKMDQAAKDKLLSTREPLRRRIVSVPRQILSREPELDINKPPLATLFGTLKEYRDSFVHCEPGGQSSAQGYVKEQLFHGVTPKLVADAVSNTESVIRLVWSVVYGKDGPSWFGVRDSSGRFTRQNLTVAPQTKNEVKTPGSRMNLRF